MDFQMLIKKLNIEDNKGCKKRSHNGKLCDPMGSSLDERFSVEKRRLSEIVSTERTRSEPQSVH